MKSNIKLSPKQKLLDLSSISKWSKQKFWFVCDCGHEWNGRFDRIANGGNCPICSKIEASKITWNKRYSKLLLTGNLSLCCPGLAKELHPTKNGNITSDQIYIGSNSKFWWKCSVADDHEWEAALSDRVGNNRNGTGCPCCSNPIKKIVQSNCLLTTHPDIAKQWHSTKNGSITPYDVVAGSNSKFWWKCSIVEGHEWIASPNGRCYNFTGCPYCCNQKVCHDNCLLTTHPDIAKQWHSTKNGVLTPFDVTFGSDKEIWWKCPVAEDHVYLMKVGEKKDRGCPICANRRIVLSNCLAVTHPEITKQWHPTKNNDLTPSDVGFGSFKKVWWKCPIAEDHEWIASIESRTRLNAGCSCCHGNTVVKSNCLATCFPEIVAEWHPTKNGELAPNQVFSGGNIKVWWQCFKNKNHVWEASIRCRTRTQKTGCPFCNESKGEKQVTYVLEKMGLHFKRQAKFKTCFHKNMLPFDFLVKTGDKKGFLIEFQGIQHYKPVKRSFLSGKEKEEYEKIKIRDEIKKQWCFEKQIPLLIIPFWDRHNIEVLIIEFIKKCT